MYIERHLMELLNNIDLKNPTKEDLSKIKTEVLFIISHSPLHSSKTLSNAIALLQKKEIKLC